MTLLLGTGYWSNEDGTASIYSGGKLGQEKTQFTIGNRHDIVALYTTGKGQRTPADAFYLDVYRYGKWVRLNAHLVRSYYSWCYWGFWIQGYYDRWFRVSFAGDVRYFQVGTAQGKDFNPFYETDEPEDLSTWEKGVNLVKSLLSDLNAAFEAESKRVDIQFVKYGEALKEVADTVKSDVEGLIEVSGDSLFVRFKILLNDGLDKGRLEGLALWGEIEGIYDRLDAVYEPIDNVLSVIDTMQRGIKGVIIDTLSAYAWYVINRILNMDIKELEELEDGRNIITDGK